MFKRALSAVPVGLWDDKSSVHLRSLVTPGFDKERSALVVTDLAYHYTLHPPGPGSLHCRRF